MNDRNQTLLILAVGAGLLYLTIRQGREVASDVAAAVLPTSPDNFAYQAVNGVVDVLDDGRVSDQPQNSTRTLGGYAARGWLAVRDALTGSDRLGALDRAGL